MIRYLTIAPNTGVIIPMKIKSVRMNPTEKSSKGIGLVPRLTKNKSNRTLRVRKKFSKADKSTGAESASHR